MKTQTTALVMLLWLALAAPGAEAATFIWTNTGPLPNHFDNQNNWDIGDGTPGNDGFPQIGDTARFNTVGSPGLASGELSGVANRQTGRIRVFDATVTINDPRGLTLNDLPLSGTQAASLRIDLGTLNLVGSPFGNVSRLNTGGVFILGGKLNVDGALTELASGDMTIGNTATEGAMTVSNGATVTSNSARLSQFNVAEAGAVTVTGAGSTWASGFLGVGIRGTGTVNISDGGNVTSNAASIADLIQSEGTVNVTGDQSRWEVNGILPVGQRGTGRLNISDGGNVVSDSAIIANFPPSEGSVNVTGDQSRWEVNGTLSVGQRGTGRLDILDNAEAQLSDNLTIGNTGIVLLDGGTLRVSNLVDDGGDFVWTAGTLNITSNDGLTIGTEGYFGATLFLDPNQSLQVDHTLTVANGGRLFADSAIVAGTVEIAPAGQMFLSNVAQNFGTGLTNNGDLVFTASSSVDGPVTNAASGIIHAIGDVTFNDLVDGPGGFFGPGTVTFAGGFSPGASPAVVPFEGSIALGSANTLNIELGGLADGQFDQLVVEGDAELDGTLALSLLAPYTPSLGDTFEILAVAGTLTGQFIGLDEGALVGNFGGEDLFISYAAGDGNDVSLFTAVPEPATMVLALVGLGSLIVGHRKE